MNTFYQAAISFTSQNLGAGEFKRLNKILISCILCVTVTGAILGYGLWCFGDFFLHMYSNDPTVISAGLVRLSYIGKIYFLCGIMDVLCGAIRGLGNSFIPMITSLVGSCLFRLVWVSTVFQMYHTQDILYLVYPISWILTATCHLFFYIIIKKKTLEKLKTK